VKTIVVGDIHGCLEEFDELLKLTEYQQGEDRLVLAGDLVDRGPDPVGVVRRAREVGAEAVMGNHEEKHIRYRRHELRRKADPKYKNPMRMHEDRLKEHEAYSEEDWAYLEALPLWLRVHPKIVVIHAGLKPGVAVEDQDKNTLMRLRFLRKDTLTMATLDELVKDGESSEKYVFWPTVWTGPDSVIYGHHVTLAHQVNSHIPCEGVFTMGIDAGCCFGGRLSAAVISDKGVDVVSVPAKQKYRTYWGWKESAE
jgi:predicted phosphodiesterase